MSKKRRNGTDYYHNSDPKENRAYYQQRQKRRAKMNLTIVCILVIIAVSSYACWYNYIFPDIYTVLGMIIPVVLIFLMLILSIIKRKRMLGASIKQIDKMDGIEFEKYLYLYYKKHGYKATITPASGDFGADLIIEDKHKIKTVIQAKRYRSHVGVEAVQQALASKEYYKADRAAVITNSFFTDPAKEMAKETGTVLINRFDIGSMKMNL